MRDILFRGKRSDNKEWFFGYVEKTASGKLTFIRSPKNEIYSNVNLVIPETVGQYTGRCARCGTKIFEGDVVKAICTYPYPFQFDEEDSQEKEFVAVGTVEYHKWHNAFGIRGVDDEKEFYFLFNFVDITILGNIHDDPELMCVEQSGNSGQMEE